MRGLALGAALLLAGCAASDLGGSEVKYDAAKNPAAPASRTDLPPEAKARMEAAMRAGGASR